VAAAQQVEVEVFDGLAAVVAGVNDYSVASGVFGQAQAGLLGDFGGGGEEVAEEGCVVGGGFGQRGEVLFGDDEDVGGGLGVDVGEGEDLVVFVEPGYWDGVGDDFAEQAHGGLRVCGWGWGVKSAVVSG